MEVILFIPTFSVEQTTEEQLADVDNLMEPDGTVGCPSLLNEDTTSEYEHLSDYSGNMLWIVH